MNQSKLEKLKQKEAQLKARIQALESKEKNEIRKAETRTKILVGSVILKAVESGKIDRKVLVSLLNSGLTKQRDRDVFDLDGEDSHGN